MASGQGTVGVALAGLLADRIDIYLDQQIHYLNVDKNPLLLLTSEAGKEAVTEMEAKWLTQERKKDFVAVTAVGGAWAAAANNAGTLTVAAADKHLFAAGDILMMPSKSKSITIYVVSVDQGTGVITAKCVVPADTLDLSAGTTTPVFLIGNSFEDGSNRGTMKWEHETERSNYIQIVQTPFGITDVARAIKYRGIDEWSKLQFEAGVDHAFKLEKQLFYGKKYYAPTGYTNGVFEQWFAGGLTDPTIGVSTNVSAAVGALTQAAFNTFLTSATKYAQSPVIFCGELIYEALTKWAETKLQLVRTDKTLGMAVANYQTAYGKQIVLIPHRELFTGTYTGEMFVVDISDLKYLFLKGYDTHIVSDIQPPGDKQKIDELRTYCSLKIGNEKRHGYMNGVTSIT